MNFINSVMKYCILLLLIVSASCSGVKNEDSGNRSSELTLKLSDDEGLMTSHFNVGELDGKTVFALFNTSNGNLRVVNLFSNKLVFEKQIPLEGPDSFPEAFFVSVFVEGDQVALVSESGRIIFFFDQNGDKVNEVKLPGDADDFSPFYFLDGVNIFHHTGNEFYLGYFNDLFPNRDINKDYFTLYNYSFSRNESRSLVPMPRENVEKFWGVGHMGTSPFGLYSDHYQSFVAGFGNSNELKIYKRDGELIKTIDLQLDHWKRPMPTDLIYEELGSLSQDELWELRSYTAKQYKIWKLHEMKEGFLLEVLEPDSEAQLPRFSVYKFDLDFNFLSYKSFFDDHFTCYQSFVAEDKYHLVDLKAYEEDEDQLVFRVFSFDDI